MWPSLVKVLEVLIHPPPLRRHPFPTTPIHPLWSSHWSFRCAGDASRFVAFVLVDMAFVGIQHWLNILVDHILSH
jgi:hypothetical protein